MFTWCTKDEWHSDEFDLEQIEAEHGMFSTNENAYSDALKHGCKDVCILEVE